jgi:hypothetical protein
MLRRLLGGVGMRGKVRKLAGHAQVFESRVGALAALK